MREREKFTLGKKNLIKAQAFKIEPGGVLFSISAPAPPLPSPPPPPRLPSQAQLIQGGHLFPACCFVHRAQAAKCVASQGPDWHLGTIFPEANV